MNETAIMHRILLALSEAGHTVFRANVGLFFTKDGRPVQTGLPKGFSDVFGFTKSGRPFFLEIKSETGRLRPEQYMFLEAMKAKGAIAGVARSVESALTICG